MAHETVPHVDDLLDDIADEIEKRLSDAYGDSAEFILIVLGDEDTQIVSDTDPEIIPKVLRDMADNHDATYAEGNHEHHLH